MGGFAPSLFRAPSLRGGKESQVDVESRHFVIMVCRTKEPEAQVNRRSRIEQPDF